MKKLLIVAVVAATTLLAAQTTTAPAAVAGANPLVAKKKGWKYKSFQATSCWLGGRPFSQKPNVFFGSPNGFRCAVAYVTVSGVVAYNGKQAWGKSINASGGGIGGALKGGASVKTTWKGYVNSCASTSTRTARPGSPVTWGDVAGRCGPLAPRREGGPQRGWAVSRSLRGKVRSLRQSLRADR
jgi:hypothetical protein